MFGCFCERAIQRSNLPTASMQFQSEMSAKVRLIALSLKYFRASKRAAIMYEQG